jgi:Fuc2NAc and GlcNAc transferase
MFPVILYYTLTFLLAMMVTRVSLAWALCNDIIDQPNHRSSHTRATPRGGGIGIVVGSTAAIAAAAILGWIRPQVAGALACGLPIAIVGYIDDRVSLSARIRLLVQAACAAAALWLLAPLPALDLFGFILPNALTVAIYFIATIWLTNLFNFMDGIDGIAAGQTIAIGIVWSMLVGPIIALPLLAIAAAAAGFLIFNRPPARIFMGDVGSAFCGFFIMVATLAVGLDNGMPWPVLWFLPAAPFILDATVTLITRMLRGKQPTVAHRSHAYQILARRIGRHGPVSAAYALVTVFWFGTAAWLSITSTAGAALLIFATAVAPGIVVLIALGTGHDD